MTPEEILSEKIEHYLKNRLSPREREDFEKQCRENPDIANALNAYAEKMSVVKAYGQSQIRASFKERQRKKEEQKRSRIIALRRYSLAAAIVLVLALLPLRYFYSSSSMHMQALYEDYFQIPAASPGRNGAYDSSHPYRQALEQYNKKQFQQVVVLLEPLLQDSSFTKRSEASFYLGLTYMALEQFEEAIKSFDRLGAESSFLQAAQWYKGLSYLGLKKKKKAIENFKNIAATKTHFQKEKAEELLDALD